MEVVIEVVIGRRNGGSGKVPHHAELTVNLL